MEFPGVLANDDVSLDIRKGEVFALVGENGAGKTTLMNILYGIHEPTNGEVYIRGRKVERFSPKTAISMGVGMVHQHFMLVPSFTVAQNIVMSREPRRLGVLFDNKAAGAARSATRRPRRCPTWSSSATATWRTVPSPRATARTAISAR